VPYRRGWILHASKYIRTRRVLGKVSEVRYLILRGCLSSWSVRCSICLFSAAPDTAVFRGERDKACFLHNICIPTAETADFVYIHFGKAFNFLFLFLFLLSYRQLSLSYRYSDTIAIWWAEECFAESTAFGRCILFHVELGVPFSVLLDKENHTKTQYLI
jgi:hypothetical protein